MDTEAVTNLLYYVVNVHGHWLNAVRIVEAAFLHAVFLLLNLQPLQSAPRYVDPGSFATIPS